MVQVRHVVGVMTGTSIDGIDAALMRIDGAGLDMRATLVNHVSASLGDLQPRLKAAADQQPMTAGEFARLSWDFGVKHAEVIERLQASLLSLRERTGVRACGDQSQVDGRTPPPPASLPSRLPKGEGGIDLICIHGQTVFHQPPISWQLVNAAPIAARFACPVVSDLRQADLARGGQGAPITPLADWVLFRDRSSVRSRAIVNLGGFCNATILPAASDVAAIRGFDICACNQLLDAIARESLGQPYDHDGESASHGTICTQAASELHEILNEQCAGGRSLGTGDEARDWIEKHRQRMSGDDLSASAVHAIAGSIARTLKSHHPDEIILAGGGSRNRALLRAISAATAPAGVSVSDDFGVPLEAREAAAFAVLGSLCQDRVPITLPQVTGCSDPPPLSGVWSACRIR